MRSSKALCILSALATALLVLSASVAAPILCRPFYYAHIAPLDLTRYGLPAEEIRRAYGEMLDYCLGLRPDFAAGVLPASPEGTAHFADVRALFLLNLGVLVLSALALAVLFAVGRRNKLVPAAPLGHGPGFWAAVGLAALFLNVGGLAALDFQRAFVVFHTLFFPGKTNWLFDWQTDPIILFLPEVFFRNCALLILALLVFWCAVLIVADLWAGRLRRTRAEGSSCSGCPGCSGGKDPSRDSGKS